MGIGNWELGIRKQLPSAIAPEFSGAKQVKIALFGARWSDRGCILNFKSDRARI
ncbi:MAG: hypothetical protein MUE44_17495 [Oscillatoriaceae cyanobacterium Prado104]|nr:hypothetical protein [Oscillatoriaceae cyanobacterium Prado104]